MRSRKKACDIVSNRRVEQRMDQRSILKRSNSMNILNNPQNELHHHL
jgi:hypothetical protein